MRKVWVAVAALALLCFSQAAFADSRTAEAKLKKLYPNFKYEKVQESPIKGLYEVVSGGDQLIYFSPVDGHMFFGDIWNKKGENLSAKKRAALMAKKAKKAPIETAVAVGDGPKKVIEISDPNCPYCKRGHEWFSKRSDVTRYVFFAAGSPDSELKAKYILAKGPAAYKEIYSGKQVSLSLTAEEQQKAEKLLSEHRKMFQFFRLGRSGVPVYIIDGQKVIGADLARLENLLNNYKEVK